VLKLVTFWDLPYAFLRIPRLEERLVAWYATLWTRLLPDLLVRVVRSLDTSC
jgi:hypothetical protein